MLLGNGDGTFQAAVNYSDGGSSGPPSSIAVADVNRDGKPDLLVPDFEHGSVSVLLGNGDGTFQAPVNYSSGGYLTPSVAVADVNGDGKPDLLVANECASASNCPNGIVSVLLGNGDGTFQAPVNYNSGGYSAYSVAVADVNGDGKPDLLVANGNGSVSVLLGNGNGTFQSAVSYSSDGYSPFSIAVADVNGDGKPDLLVTNECLFTAYSCLNGSVSVLLGNGDGTFQAAVNYNSGGIYADSVAVADVNGDGKPDLLVADECASASNCPNGIVSVLLGNGDGTFQGAVGYNSGGLYAQSIAVADVNGNGKPDLIVANAECASGNSNGACANDAGVVSVLLGNGDGTFQTAVIYNSDGYMTTSVAVADVNGDGKPDLLLANEFASSSNLTSGSVAVLLGNGDGTFQAALNYNSGIYAVSIAVADVNGDGHPDLIVANECASGNSNGACTNDAGVVSVLLGNGDGTFQAAVSYNSGGIYAASVAVADVNGDGHPDLLVANNCTSSNSNGACTNDTGVVGVLLGNGDGTFQAPVNYSSGDIDAESIAVADVNGDGRPDLIVANQTSVGVLLGNGDGTFQGALTTATGPLIVGQIALADFNGDGKLDVTGTGGVLLLGNGDGTFRTPVNLGASGPGIAVGDFNGDGRPDVAVGGVTVLLNIGETAAATTTTISPSAPQSYSAFQSVTLTAQVQHTGTGTPTGTVEFLDRGVSIGTTSVNSSGQSSLTMTSLAVGSHFVVAYYQGDSNFAPSNSLGVHITINKASTTVAMASSLNPSGFGEPVTFSAMITPQYSGQASGTVTFKDGATTLGSVAVSGNVANVTTSGLAVGTHSITAVYSGDSNFTGSTSPLLSQAVQGPAVRLSLTRLTFPTQVVFTTSAARTVTLTNTGLGILSITKVSVTGSFTQTNTCGTSVGSGGTCEFSVKFEPTKSGTLAGSVSITDDASGSPQEITLAGTGTDVQLAPTSLSFGNQPVGKKSLAKKVTLSNKASIAVSITGISITGTDKGNFAQTNTCVKSVAAGGSCFIEVTFEPSADGKRTADVSVSDNGGGSPQEVSLAGTGTP